MRSASAAGAISGPRSVSPLNARAGALASSPFVRTARCTESAIASLPNPGFVWAYAGTGMITPASKETRRRAVRKLCARMVFGFQAVTP